MELFITKCLKGYVKATKFLPISQKKFHKFQSHMLLQFEISISVISM